MSILLWLKSKAVLLGAGILTILAFFARFQMVKNQRDKARIRANSLEARVHIDVVTRRLEKANRTDLVEKLKDIKKTKHSTQPPARLSEKKLSEMMEKEGVGRPSTRDVIITSIQKKGYVEKEKGKGKKGLVATILGMKINDYLSPNFKDFFMDIKYTASIENDVNEIAHGNKQFLGVLNEFYDVLKEQIKKAGGEEKKEPHKMGAKCTVCKEGEILEKEGKFGKFFACSRYKEGCKVVYVQDEEGNFSVKKKKEVKKLGRKCPECEKKGRDGELVERSNSKSGDKFIGCNKYPACRYSEKVE